MFAVVTATAAENRALVRGGFDFRVREDGGERRTIFVRKLARIGCNAGIDCRLQALVDLEQFGREAPAGLKRNNLTTCQMGDE